MGSSPTWGANFLLPDCENKSLGALALADLDAAEQAIATHRDFIRQHPANTTALNNLADLLATHPDATLCNGQEAVQHAQAACVLTGHQNPLFVLTLAEAQAETSNFTEAITLARQASELARSLGQSNLVETIHTRLRWFAAGVAVRQSPRASGWPPDRPLQWPGIAPP